MSFNETIDSSSGPTMFVFLLWHPSMKQCLIVSFSVIIHSLSYGYLCCVCETFVAQTLQG